jgi:hypothetical protein
MRTLLRYQLLIVLSFVIGVTPAGAKPSRDGAVGAELASQPSTGSFEPIAPPILMLLVGAGLVVVGGILRRRPMTRAEALAQDK